MIDLNKNNSPSSLKRDRSCTIAFSLLVSTLLSACGGADNQLAANQTQPLPLAEIASGTTSMELSNPVLPTEVAMQAVQPTYHLAPVLLDAPADMDVADNSRSARMPAAIQSIPHEFQGLHGRGLTVGAIKSVARDLQAPPPATDGLKPLAGTGSVTTFTPAQIRAAYGMPALPASTTALTSAQAAQLGAGQTIYIVDAMHDPSVVAELAAFNQKFGLPNCTSKSIAASSSLPLPAASSSACEFSVVTSTNSGSMSSAAPTYDSGWATEIALDVQWAHATAPLARIILIETMDTSMNSLLGGIKLANAMGPGVVSMSFGSNEGSWTSSTESTFTTAKMTYLAASGDSGPSVQWPAVSPNVVAVGGTSLSYSGSIRSEQAWSSTGGGVSAYTATPSYQTNAVPDLGTPARRTVADVAMNANPSTGQYVAIMSPSSSAVSWVSAGGTSLATPQWAGIIAVANASLAQAGKPMLGAPHTVLYTKIATVPGSYASAFADVTSGSNGSCSTCVAKTGYDQLTGLGSPNVSNLLTALGGVVVNTAPVVTSATISGQTGSALTFTVSAVAANPISYSLSGAPAGMTISTAGIVSWATPITGTYAVTVTALDGKTSLSGKGVYTIVIAAPKAPVVANATIYGKVGTALSFNVTASSSNALIYALTGAPAGMSINAAGVVNWASPVAGNYAVTVIAKDSKTGLSGQAVYNVSIASITASGLVINAPALTGVAGKALSGSISITDPGVSSVSVSISGAPLGLNFGMNGLSITLNWGSPVTGTYALKISVTDSAGHTATSTMPITIAAK